MKNCSIIFPIKYFDFYYIFNLYIVLIIQIIRLKNNGKKYIFNILSLNTNMNKKLKKLNIIKIYSLIYNTNI